MTVPIEPGEPRQLRNGKLRTPVHFTKLLPRESFERITDVLRSHSGYFHPIQRVWLIPGGSYKKVEAAVAEVLGEERAECHQ